jgi:hypothetical protein
MNHTKLSDFNSSKMNMAPSTPPSIQDKHDMQLTISNKNPSRITKKFWLILAAVFLVLAIGLGIGLGVGLTQGSGSSDSSSNPTSTPSSLPSSNTTGLWAPSAGTTWQIVLKNPPTDLSLPVAVYDIDLFDNPASTISSLQSGSKRVICYFSAGSYEPNRPDSAKFTSADKGKELDGWPGEFWLNTSSPNVRSIMSARIALAKNKGCDGVDPDNIDAYDNTNGLSLTTEDAVDFIGFLATTAHGLNLSIGLKNGGKIVSQTIGMMEWEVNEQCVQYGECDTFRPFIEAGKPVFHIEYPDGAPKVSASEKSSACGDSSEQGFSTVLKNMDLDDWVETC